MKQDARRGSALPDDGRRRVVIEAVEPEIDAGRFPIKRVPGEPVEVTADVFGDGHDLLGARVLYREAGERRWREAPMAPVENDRWTGTFSLEALGRGAYTVEAWVDHFATWRRDLLKRRAAGQDLAVELRIGAALVDEALARAGAAPGADRLRERRDRLLAALAADPGRAADEALAEELAALMAEHADRSAAARYERELEVVVDPPRALFSTWYEFFPRSCPAAGGHGTFADCERFLPYVAGMGFDVVYLPPVHPIGATKRKGRNNAVEAAPGDVGSPWAIGSEAGGHDALHPDLGTIADFERFVRRARELGLETAMDLALQCSPDHPWVREHPTWFRQRPDGTVQYAENPPKKYEDIYPLNFETPDWRALWEEVLRVVGLWMERGVRIFRVDNPHTKPFAFWEWLIGQVKARHPEAIFLSEAFTRPKVMYRLAKAGFTQSYTYFTWRYTKGEFTAYMAELARGRAREFFRPNFWPNTPDILPEHLQYGGRPAFLMRYLLAATLSSNTGIYGPAFELCAGEPVPGKEEYRDSEKYEVKRWDLDRPESLRDVIARVNRIRRENPALQTTWNLEFAETDNEHLLAFLKADPASGSTLLVVVSLDPFRPQAGSVSLPLERLGIDPRQSFLVHDLIGEEKFIWEGERHRLEIDPRVMPGFIFRLRTRLRRETDFDYFL